MVNNRVLFVIRLHLSLILALPYPICVKSYGE